MVFLFALFLPLLAGAKEPSVRGELSESKVRLGESVEYNLIVEQGSLSEARPDINVDGLRQEERVSDDTRMNLLNGDRSTTLTYTLTPTRAGKFTIPELTVKVSGRELKTQAVTLTVEARSSERRPNDTAFGEIRLEKNTAYVGEPIALELRIFVNGAYRFSIPQMPGLTGDNVSFKGYARGQDRGVAIDGARYMQLTLHSAATPVKPGKLSVSIKPLTVQVGRDRGGGLDFLDPRMRMGDQREIEITIPDAELEVKALPVQDRPPEFNGAVGKFDMEVIGTPNRVNVGEPVQMVVKIRGTGNFDRVTTPGLTEPKDWQAYDAEQDFAKSDNVGLSGTKTFKLPVAPTVTKTTMPVFSFAFFDPEKGKYQTLRNNPTPLTVIGGAAPAPAAVATPAAPTPPAPAPEKPPVAAAPPVPQDILGVLPEMGTELRWNKLSSPLVLFGLMAAPLPLLLLLRWWRRDTDPKAARLASLRWERGTQHHRVRHGKDRAEVLDAAARVLQLDAALTTGRPPQEMDLAAVLGARRVPDSAVTVIESLFSARAELLYAGGGGAETLSPTERDRVLEAIATYERSATK